mmetsp:Transcript_126188/g.403326  ORF Transcript_126188/g.403326 Transcript_126188/m.403326 type:complete len:338 (+) Transcript_126188:122-1135(+)
MAHSLSARAARVLALPKPSFTSVYYASLGKLYDPVTRPSGIVNLAVAENRLAAPLIMERLAAAGSGAMPESLAYNPYAGSDRLRAAVARVASRHIARCSVDPANVILTNGAGSALWLLAANLADAGQGILVPTPYYYAYDRDFGALTDCQVVPFDRGDGGPLDPAALSAALSSAASRGVTCRVLAITNPSNPTGEVVSVDEVRAAIDWAGEHGVDVIVNELYACSARPTSGFRSVLEMYQDGNGSCKLPEHVHFVWGLSKDFAVNGLRCGCIYSGSSALTEAATKFACFFQVGGTVQVQLADVLEDDAWVDSFLQESLRRVTGALDETEAVRLLGLG